MRSPQLVFDEIAQGLWCIARLAHAGRNQAQQRKTAAVEQPELLEHGEGVHAFALERSTLITHDQSAKLVMMRAGAGGSSNKVSEAGQPELGKLMRTGAGAGGTPYLPTRFRWGFGWRWPRGYGPLSDEEKTLAEEASR